ncbi:hypothetical protein [Magnetofaba australis]|uniref:hypothetical protein n=1 Tax=Magnetofaba australis TaxID=1472297 RepID=UPI001301DF0F|nr:hypothetical protein [Magnetofaba australis]
MDEFLGFIIIAGFLLAAFIFLIEMVKLFFRSPIQFILVLLGLSFLFGGDDDC